MYQRCLFILCLLSLALPRLASAQPNVTVELRAEKIVSETVDGRTIEKRLPADNAEPGDVILYTLAYVNTGDQAARDVKLNGRIPSGTRYVDGSASTDGALLRFSTDDGTTFDAPVALTATDSENINATPRPAGPDDYTTIRWLIEELPAGASGTFSYRVRIR